MADRTRGWRNRTRAPSSSRPAAWAGVAAPVSMPCFSTARHNSVTSPVGSAAAVSNSRRVSSGSAWTCRWKLCSIRLATAGAPGSPKPPASSAAVNPSGSCSSASGFPRASAMIRSRTRSSRRPRIAAANTSRASLSPSGEMASSGRPTSSRSSLGSRTLNTSASRSATARRATKARTWREARSSHCASSMRQASGLSVRHIGQQSSGRRDRPGTCPEHRLRPARRPPAARRVAVPAAARPGRASARRAGAGRQTRVPSRTRRRGRGRYGNPMRARVGSPAAPSCQNRPHRAEPRRSCYPHAPHPADVRVPRTRRAVPAVWARPWWMVVTAPTSLASCCRNGFRTPGSL